jgi:cytochrome c553
MQQRRTKKQILAKMAVLSIVAMGLAGCGGGGGDSSSVATTSAPATTATPASTAVTGTVPGTLIEAFCDNGAYYSVNSTQNGTDQHPFRLDLPPDLGCRLVMTTNEGTAQEVVSPIGFLDSDNILHTRLVLKNNTVIDLGHVALPMSHAEAANSDTDGDGILDAPFILDNYQSQGARNPLKQIDADNDGIDDWQDPDHGEEHRYTGNTTDPLDVDGDGIPNRYDDDFIPEINDTDKDGIPDHIDANPDNHRNGNGHFNDDLDGDGYHDDDHNRDGFHDDDTDRDGFHDDDQDRDGFHDDDQDRDGFPDSDHNRNGLRDADEGAILFGTYCATCHEPDGSDLSTTTPEAIGSAVNNIAVMSSMAAQLTEQDYLPLAAYINRADHDENWYREHNHGNYAEHNSVTICAACHGGPQLGGNNHIPSCYSCHDDEWSTDVETPNPTGNTVPVANAGPDQSVNTGDTVSLDGSASSDADNDTLTYQWTLAGTPAGSTAFLSDTTAAGPTFTADFAGTYTLNLVVNDGQADSVSDTMTVTATDVPASNVAPLANAGNNQNVNTGDTFNLDGSGSSDANNDQLTYSWTITSSPNGSAAALSDGTAIAPSFTADLSGTYTVQLVVNDGLLDSTVSTVTITAADAPPQNSAPVANAGSNQNVNEGDLVNLDGSASSDADNDQLTYNWTITSSPNGSAATLSDAAAVSPTFTADLAGTYTVQLVVNDGTVNSNTSAVTITAVAAAPAIDGAALYSSRCSGCHGNMGNRSAAQITSAINANRGGMGFLSFLTTAEIDAIAAFLGP